jgi:dihydrofolate reductase
MKIALIAVLDKANGIGKDNKLLCHLPADLKRFKLLTTGHTIVMGRKTFESLPNGPLPNRKNIILTRDMNYKAQACNIIHSFEEVIEECKIDEKIFIIGGGEIYKTFIQNADLLYITRINYIFDADTFFPEIATEKWQQDSYTEFDTDEKNNYKYAFVEYSKRNLYKI